MANSGLVVVPLKAEEKFTRLLSGIPQTKGMRSGLVELKPQEEIGAHSTKEMEEALVLLSGKALVFYGDGASQEVDSPALVYIPPRTGHNVKNIGKEPLRYVYVVAPSIPYSPA